MSCAETTVAVAFDKNPKKCCVDTFFTWKVYGEGQKLKCGICNNLLSSCRIEKGSFISEGYKTVCAFFLRKAVFSTRGMVDKWLSNNPWNRMYDRTSDEMVEVDVVREAVTGWVVVRQPYDWFAMGTLKAQWTSVGIVVISGNLREDVDDRIPTDAELQATADFVERI